MKLQDAEKTPEAMNSDPASDPMRVDKAYADMLARVRRGEYEPGWVKAWLRGDEEAALSE